MLSFLALTFQSHLCHTYKLTGFSCCDHEEIPSFLMGFQKICEGGPKLDKSPFCNSEEEKKKSVRGEETILYPRHRFRLFSSYGISPILTTKLFLLRLSEEKKKSLFFLLEFANLPILGFFGGQSDLKILSKCIGPQLRHRLSAICQKQAPATDHPLRARRTLGIKMSKYSHLLEHSHILHHSNKICSVNDLIIKVRSSRINNSVLLCLLSILNSKI